MATNPEAVGESQEPIRLSPEERLKIERGIADLARGDTFTHEEALAHARRKANEWILNQQNSA